MARRLKGCLRAADTLARLGGDEFTVLLTHLAQPGDARLVAQKLLEVLQQPFELNGADVSLAGSVGMASLPDDATDAATLLRYQQNVSKQLANTPGVVSGIWLTRSTLSVERSGDDAQVWPLICQQLQRYPALRTTRVQLNPRPGVDEPVRWRQCSTI